MNELEQVNSNAVETVRNLETVAAEIRTFTASMLNNIIEIGRRLVEAKELCPHGEFEGWVRTQTGYSTSTAKNFMRLYKEYGAEQGSLFGAEVNRQTFGDLTYSKALALLALPAEEREEFVESHAVSEMSTRELEQAIKERDEAKAALQEEKEMSAAMEEQARAADDIAQKAADRVRRLEQELEELKTRPIDVAVEAADPEEVKKAVDAAVAAEREKAKGEMDKLSDKLDKAKAEREKLAARLKEAEAKAGDAAAGANAEVEELRRQLAMADPVTAEFKGLFAQAGQLVGRMLELVEQAPEEKRPNLTAALEALAGQMTATAGS